MSGIRNRTVLCLVSLPKKLTSHRNLLAHFSKFGEVKNMVIKKEHRSAMIKFTNHFEAQAAKIKGKEFEEKSLNIFWSDSTSLDPRSKENQELVGTESEHLWQDDDKECFGVESPINIQESRKKSAKHMIKQHLKLPLVKRRVGAQSVDRTTKETLVSQKTQLKSTKVGPKTLVSLKKSLLTEGNTRKLVRKGKDSRSDINKSKFSNIQDQLLKPTAFSLTDMTDPKHKLKLLDERDKLIRKGTVQDSNINTAVAIKGTCPDMCPERERTLRQVGHAVATYEMIPGTYEMDENKAVKEYIRSSADQEVPLPHDLRPEPVLSMTMNYLITNIITKIDNPDENKAVWYSFCWNRLRSVRKDIILQQLCDIETVTIVEQCARFHISCYDHMWGAEVSGFDDKINTKNLIDCLQTLKHMYEDLAKHNITCPNESEFYSYLILLKLMSGDVMWEYQQYSPEMQRSYHVQLAIEAYMAFKNNMYSKYFNLVKRASYLTACLMQRYFEQVRIQALKTMSRAYSLPGRTVGLSSSFIVSSLKFDSQKNALRFCEEEEVDVKVDCDAREQDSYVTSSSFLIREKRLPIANAVVGENKALPVYIPHQVHSSVNDNGLLKDSLTLELNEENQREILGDSFYFDENIKTDDSFYSDEDIKPADVVLEPASQQPSFIFSLSPKVQENSLEENMFFRESATNKTLAINLSSIKNEAPVLNQDLKKNKTENMQYFDMDDNMEEELNYEKSKIYSNFTVNNDTPFLSLPSKADGVTSDHPTLSPLQKNSPHKQATNIFSNLSPISYFSNQDRGDSIAMRRYSNENLSLVDSKRNVISTTNGYFYDQGTVNMDVVHQECASNIGGDYNSIGFEPTLSKNDNVNRIPTDRTLKYQPSFLLSHDTTDLKKENFSFDRNEGRNQIESSLKPQVEAYKQKSEEFKRLELEKKLKKIEDQKKIEARIMLTKLKKDLSIRMKAYNARKYGLKYFSIWREKVKLLKQSRDFPMLVPLSVKCHLYKWGSITSVPSCSIFDRAKEKRSSYLVMSQLLQSGITDSCKYIAPEVAEKLAKSAARSMNKSIVRPIYWKLALSVPWTETPSYELSVFNQLIKRWYIQSFFKDGNGNFSSVESLITSIQIPVNISIHLFDDLQSNEDLQGIDALIFIVVDDIESDVTCLERLQSLVSSQVKDKDVPVAVMNLGGTKFETMLQTELLELQKENVITHWTVNSWKSPDSIMQSIFFLAENFVISPNICASSLEALVRQVCEELFDALSSGQHSNIGLMEAVKIPNIVIHIYNTSLKKLENLLRSRHLGKYFNFAEEFKMHVPLNESGGPELLCGNQYNDEYRYLISKKINSLKLPEFSNWPVKSPNRLIKTLKTYCTQVHDASVFPQIIRMIDLPDDTDLKHHLKQFSWLNIVEIWVQCCIRHTFLVEKKRKQFFVVFDKNEVKSLVRNQWWLKFPAVVQLDN